MEVKKMILWFLVWLFIFLVAPRPSEREEDKELIEVPSIRDIIGEEIARVKQEQAEKELETMRAVHKEEQRKLEEEQKQRERVKEVASRSIPSADTSMKTYMDYRKITNKSSAQYKLQQRDDIYTDNEGFRKIGDNFIVAVGTYYSSTVGDCLEIGLSTGRVFKAIVGDIKANIHTDNTNRRHRVDGSVVEFLVDTKNMDSMSRKMGNMSYAEVADLKGNVVSIKNLGNIYN